MDAEAAYRWLIGAAAARDPFDLHVVAAILSLAIAEAEVGSRTVADGVGLARADLLTLLGELFPGAASALAECAGDLTDPVDEEEESVRDILLMHASGGAGLARPLAAMVARRCKSPHHLWQDLGLRNRGELSQLMRRHFAGLADKNRQDMKWKKFLYRMVCGSEGFTLCTAPVCAECDDFALCFDAEDGQARLAWARNPSQLSA